MKYRTDYRLDLINDTATTYTLLTATEIKGKHKLDIKSHT